MSGISDEQLDALIELYEMSGVWVSVISPFDSVGRGIEIRYAAWGSSHTSDKRLVIERPDQIIDTLELVKGIRRSRLGGWSAHFLD